MRDRSTSTSRTVSTPVGGISTPLERTETPLTDISDYSRLNDIAVVGMSCRVAGGNDNPEKLWQSIMDKKDASGEVPEWRWEPYLRRDNRNAKALKETTSKGYFLDNLEDFDAPFFGISPKEAEQMDPQQRITLEVTWEALENAGIPPQSLSGSDTAVFMGVNSDDYSKLLLEDVPNVEAWMGIGTAYCGVPNRISYHLNLMGPSTAVDAACASSLVAIHHARQAILAGESKVAIAGGVNALCGPGLTAVLDKAGAITPEGCCRSFDEAANGYGRGEGVAVVVLKRLDDAILDGDNVLAVLIGSAVAQDGKTNGIMAPNAKAQELVARTALDVGNVDPATVQYIEAHATSTPLGDPTEVSAMAAIYGVGRPIDDPCYIGSVKPNVGHLEAGAGAIGFVKAILAMNKGIIPPQTNLHNLNPKIDWKNSGVQVLKEPKPWPSVDGPRRAAICSYGYGGTVSHAVIEEYRRPPGSIEINDLKPTSPTVLVLSSPREKDVAVQAQAQADWISTTGSEYSLGSIARTLTSNRGHHEYRAAFVVQNHEDAAEALSAFVNGSAKDNTFSSRVTDSCRDVVWVFSGHGAQWKEMGQRLLTDPIFYDTIMSLESVVEAEAGFSALQALHSGDFNTTDKIQVLTYVTQVGLNNVLQSKGVKPQAIIGHSVGEIAASVAAGCLTQEEGALIVTKRAKLYRQMMGLGSMVLVNRPFTEMQTEMGARTDLCAAIDSSPSSCVVSGLTGAIENLVQSLKSRNIKCFKVKTDIAFHSPMLEKLSRPLSDALANTLSPKMPKIPFYSTSTLDPRELKLHDASYWINNMVSPVHLTSAVNSAADDGLRLFVEVSTHPIISQSISETLMDKDIEDFSVFPVMKRSQSALDTVTNCIAQMFCQGAQINWSKLNTETWCPAVPTTAWSHKPIWRKIETGPLSISALHDVDAHTLLGQLIPVANEDTFIYTTKLDDKTKPFPGSHPLHGSEIVPAAALVNTFLHATGANVLTNITLRVPVAISAPLDIQVVAHRDQVKICSRLIQEPKSDSIEMSWVTHTTGFWSKNNCAEPKLATTNIKAIKARIGTRLADDFSIDYLDKVGVSAMGFPWVIDEHFGNLEEMIAHVDVAPGLAHDAQLSWDENSWAPILDAATSVGSTIFFDNPRLRMPAQIERVEIYTSLPPPKLAYLYVEKDTKDAFTSHVTVLSETGEALAKFASMRFSEIEGTPGSSGSVESLVHQLAWLPASYSEKPLIVENVILITQDNVAADNYAKSSSLKNISVIRYALVADLVAGADSEVLSRDNTVVVYAPGHVSNGRNLQFASEQFIAELLDLVKLIVNNGVKAQLFALTNSVATGQGNTALAQSPLHGLCRIIASEHPDQWGGLIDVEDDTFPMQAVKYVRDQDVIRIDDGVPRVPRLRPLPREKLQLSSDQRTLMPRPEGTYLITGGLGALGLEISSFLVEQGARRLILLSRRALPPRSTWATEPTTATQRIQELERLGASVHCLAMDIGAADGAKKLKEAVERLNLPRVLGVIHAAGVLEDQLVMETTADSFNRVLTPKITGSLVLDALYPPQILDFFILFSSCGQLFGFPGQASYASGNAFLDTLATHRRQQGDNAIAFQWTSWRALGMASSTDFINAELESRGITDITPEEGFRAWHHADSYDMDHAVVLRSMAFGEGEMLPSSILTDIAVRKATNSEFAKMTPAAINSRPLSGPELKIWVEVSIKGCVVRVLQMEDISEVDARVPLSDMGVDSVMTVSLRKQLQSTLGVKVPPTLTWSYPTVGHLVGWFIEKLQDQN